MRLFLRALPAPHPTLTPPSPALLAPPCPNKISAALDTYTDSNTRERTPYEADGIIAASGRLLVQRDFLWGRHSHSYVLLHSTWPVEWKQITPFLGWQDYMATGQADLAVAFADRMHDLSFIAFMDNATGVLRTDTMGRHIV